MKTLIKTLLILLASCSMAFGQTITPNYTDVNATGTGDGSSFLNAYNSLNVAEAARQADYVALDILPVYHLQSSGGGDDTTAVTFTGSNTDANHPITVTQDDFPVSGIGDDTKYCLHNNDFSTIFFQLIEGHVNILNLQMKVTKTSTNGRIGIYIPNSAGAGVCNFDKLIIKGICSGTGESVGVQLAETDMTSNITNSTIYGFVSGAETNLYAIKAERGVVSTYNCTLYGNSKGLIRGSSTATAINCAVANNLDDFSGTITIDYCLSDDGDGTNSQGPVDPNWFLDFSDPDNGDFTVVADSNLIGNGTDDPSGGLAPTDITGATWTFPQGIGAFQFAGAGPTPTTAASIPAFIYRPRYNIPNGIRWRYNQ